MKSMTRSGMLVLTMTRKMRKRGMIEQRVNFH